MTSRRIRQQAMKMKMMMARKIRRKLGRPKPTMRAKADGEEMEG